ncbi:hypothetical protein L208DRAFT_811694 [Tricholoma matsutake]|nr:hypothetical protein L208DRAFT_811694 [Tricholoma matsutake 945]
MALIENPQITYKCPYARLRHVGITLLTNLARLTTTTLLHGIFIMVFSIAVHTTLHRGLKSHATLAIFILIILSFTEATIFWAAKMAFGTIQMCSVLVKNVGMELSEKMALSSAATAKLVLIEIYLSPLTWVINDIVVIWRAWVLFPRCQWVMVGPLFFLLVTFVTMLIGLATAERSQNMFIIMSYCSFAASIVTNLLATLLIAYKLWDYQKATKNLGLKKQQSPVQKVLFLLVESGVIFLILQLANLLLDLLMPNTPGTAAYYAYVVFGGIYYELVAMYPALILIIVNKKHSIIETVGFNTVLGSNLNGEGHATSAEHRPATIGHLVFANHPTENNVDSEQLVLTRHPNVPNGLEKSSDSSMV